MTLDAPGTTEVREVRPGDANALAAFFDGTATPCHCRYWHFEGTKNAWLERCAFDVGTNRDAMRDAVARRTDEGRGVVAFEGPDVVGWAKLAPRGSLPKLGSLPVYRARKVDPGEAVLALGCVLVRPDRRRRGIARALVRAAISVARTGRASLEAYPRHVDAPVSDEELWMGPEAVFAREGFRPTYGEAPYRVWRWDPPPEADTGTA
ncbi:MAG: GNAT family N-acetyltransferase [Polyangiaceae bacterium]